MSDLGPGTDVSADDLDVEDGADERPETSDPDAFDGDPTLGGLGGADETAGGDG